MIQIGSVNMDTEWCFGHFFRKPACGSWTRSLSDTRDSTTSFR